MWTFTKKKKQTASKEIGFTISAELSHIVYNEQESAMIKAGCKEGPHMVYYPPDTVFAQRHSEVYHVKNDCCGSGVVYETEKGYAGFIMPEAEALRRGLRRCERCNWTTPQPEPARKQMKTKIAFVHDKSEDY